MTSSEEATVDPLNCDRTGSFLPPKVECLTPSGSITGFVTVGKFLHFINLNRFALFVFDFASQLISYYFQERRFYVLIGTLLSSQTKDHVTGGAFSF